jgi:hypothetical protein
MLPHGTSYTTPPVSLGSELQQQVDPHGGRPAKNGELSPSAKAFIGTLRSNAATAPGS